jgi:hypothetical protein
MPAVVRLLCVGGCIDGVYVCGTVAAAAAAAAAAAVAEDKDSVVNSCDHHTVL